MTHVDDAGSLGPESPVGTLLWGVGRRETHRGLLPGPDGVGKTTPLEVSMVYLSALVGTPATLEDVKRKSKLNDL